MPIKGSCGFWANQWAVVERPEPNERWRLRPLLEAENSKLSFLLTVQAMSLGTARDSRSAVMVYRLRWRQVPMNVVKRTAYRGRKKNFQVIQANHPLVSFMRYGRIL